MFEKYIVFITLTKVKSINCARLDIMDMKLGLKKARRKVYTMAQLEDFFNTFKDLFTPAEFETIFRYAKETKLPKK